MATVEIPPILDKLARAGEKGIPLPTDGSSLRDVSILKSSGFAIKASGDRLFLPRDEDLMVPAWMEQETPAIMWEKFEVAGFLEAGSTNDEALRRLRQGAQAGLVVCAEAQATGKGRLGRRWFSPPGRGIYMSLVLRPRQPAAKWPLLGLAASVAVGSALVDFSQFCRKVVRIELKWPNDVLLSGRKVAGILVESVFGGPGADGAVLGCGINVSRGSFPPDLAHGATAAAEEFGVAVPRRWLAVRFLRHFQELSREFDLGRHEEILERWKSMSGMWRDTPILVSEAGRLRSAVTCGLTPEGALRIRAENGAEEIVLAGDVSVRRSSGDGG